MKICLGRGLGLGKSEENQVFMKLLEASFSLESSLYRILTAGKKTHV